MVDPDLLARMKSEVAAASIARPHRIRIDRVEHPEPRVTRGDAEHLPQHLGSQARSAHAEQHHVSEARVANRTCERLQASYLRA